MILAKKFDVNFEDIDSVILTLAEEIKKGYKIYNIEHYPFECSINTLNRKPCATITLINKECNKY